MRAFSVATRSPAKLGRPSAARGRRAVLVKAESRVPDLIARDKKNAKVVDESAFADPSAAPASSSQPAASVPAAKSSGKGGSKQKEEQGPQRSREAIDLGLAKFKAGEYQAAIELFELALELPGSGVMRMAGSPKEYSCPSDGEEQAALYNMACAYAKLGQPGPALTCIEGLLETEFEDFETLRKDPDLAPLRGPQLEALLSKRDSMVGRLLGGSKKQQKELPSSKKPWILW